MKKLIVCLSLVAMIVIAIIAFDSITTVNTEAKTKKTTSMFVEIESTDTWKVVYHKDTKVMYTVSQNGEFTVLVNANGSIMKYQ